MNSDTGWIHGLVDNIREAQHEQSVLLHNLMHNLGNLCARIDVQQNRQDQQISRIIELLELAVEPSARNSMATGFNLNKLLQWPIPLYLISAGLLMANFKAPEIAEILKVFVAIQ